MLPCTKKNGYTSSQPDVYVTGNCLKAKIAQTNKP